jgi:hypothetical protein
MLNLVLLMTALGFMLWAIITFIRNTRPGQIDEMGRSMTFHGWWLIGAVPMSVWVAIQPEIAWWWGVVAFACLMIASPLLVQPLLEFLLRLMRWPAG